MDSKYKVIKTNISFKEKEIISTLCADNYFVKDIYDNIIDFSEINKEKTLAFCVLNYYTDANIDNIVDEDAFIEEIVNDPYYRNEITEEIWEDYCLIEKAIVAKIEFRKRKIDEKNNIAIVVKDFLDKLITKIPNVEEIPVIMDKFKDFDMNKFGALQDALKVLKG